MVGRQLARVSSTQYKETIWSELYAGNQHTVHCLQPAVENVESSLELGHKQRRRTVWRLDGGGGSDANLRWLLARDYQVVAKGKANRRAIALAKKVRRWDMMPTGWVAEVAPPVDLGRPARFFVKKRIKNDTVFYSYYVSTLQYASKRLFLHSYDQRGAAEVEQFRQDKSGLSLALRRKRLFSAQRGLIHLTDLAHNLLADFHKKALLDSKFASFGPKRIVRDLLQISGYLHFDNGQLSHISLCNSNEHAKNLIICLERYCFGD